METETGFETLIDIIKNKEIKIIAEIGIWRSRLMGNIFKRCKNSIIQYWAIDIFEQSESHKKYKKTTKEQWDYLYLKACKKMIYFPQIHVIKTSSLDASKLFSPDYFDLVFIDADHHYDAILSDIEAWLPLVRNNGFLIGDDYGGHHRGIKRVVDRLFGDDKIIKYPFWIKQVVK